MSGIQGFGLNTLVLRTFALAHLNTINEFEVFDQEKPVGAMILAMQAARVRIILHLPMRLT